MFQRWLAILQFLELLILSTCDSFGDNIIINSKFSLPILPYGSGSQIYSNIPGWSC